MRVYYAKSQGQLEPLNNGPGKHVIWGDWLDVEEDESSPDHYLVAWRTSERRDGEAMTRPYRVRKDECQEAALLEMIFLDVGQGDGCIVSVPEGNRQRILIVDAGETDNTHRFLNWRFRNIDEDGSFEAAVLTHPDSDHYGGFKPVFEDSRVSFRAVYHNGLIDRGWHLGDDRLGRRRDGNCIDICVTRDDLSALLQQPPAGGFGSYPELLQLAVQAPERFGDVRMASTAHGETVAGRTYLPGFAPDANGKATIEIVGPVPTRLGDDTLVLREFADTPRGRTFDAGKTKNGHSVLLKLCYGGLRILFGGDLNRSAEDYLLRHYGRIDERAPLAEAIKGAQERLAADILKCCHHGSADVTDEFIRAVRPFGVVVSSGDEESHVHPRPEVLGLLGKQSRGDRPIILCTEILRSTPEKLTMSKSDRRTHDKLLDAVGEAKTRAQRIEARSAVEAFWKAKIGRLVTVYGAINVRTDGRKMIVAFRKEQGGSGSAWQIYEYELVDDEWKGREKPTRKRPRRS